MDEYGEYSQVLFWGPLQKGSPRGIAAMPPPGGCPTMCTVVMCDGAVPPPRWDGKRGTWGSLIAVVCNIIIHNNS